MRPVSLLSDSDLNEIDAFHRLCFPGDHFTRDAWEELLPDPRTLVYALRGEEGLLSLLAIYNWENEDDYVKIMTLCTHPAVRQQGFASQLFSQMAKDMAQRGMRLFKAETRVSNLPMQALFQKLGFVRTQRVPRMLTHPTEDGYKYQLLLPA